MPIAKNWLELYQKGLLSNRSDNSGGEFDPPTGTFDGVLLKFSGDIGLQFGSVMLAFEE